MSLPASPELEEALSAVFLTSDSKSDRATQVVPERHLVFGKARTLEQPIYASVPDGLKISVPALLKRASEELRKVAHPATDTITKAVMALFMVTRRNNRSAIEQFNAMLTHIVEVDVIDTVVAAFPPHPDVHPFTVDRFLVGPLNLEKMRYRCSKVGCDFFERDPEAFRSRLAIESGVQRTSAIDVRQIHSTSQLAPEVTDHYFESLTMLRRESFIRQFRDAHIVQAAAGAPDLDLTNVFSWKGSTFTTLFQGFPGTRFGYFCPLGMAVVIDFAQIDSRLPQMQRELRLKYGFDSFSNSEIHSNLRVYSDFVVQARSHKIKDELGDALLKYVIALELLFGEKSRSNESVSTRVAVIKALGKELSFEDSVREVAATYDKRSRYVHEGKPPAAHEVDTASELCDIVLKALLQIQSRPKSHEPGFLREWWKHLDFVAAALRAGKPITSADMELAGVNTASSGTGSPLH